MDQKQRRIVRRLEVITMAACFIVAVVWLLSDNPGIERLVVVLQLLSVICGQLKVNRIR